MAGEEGGIWGAARGHIGRVAERARRRERIPVVSAGMQLLQKGHAGDGAGAGGGERGGAVSVVTTLWRREAAEQAQGGEQ